MSQPKSKRAKAAEKRRAAEAAQQERKRRKDGQREHEVISGKRLKKK